MLQPCRYWSVYGRPANPPAATKTGGSGVDGDVLTIAQFIGCDLAPPGSTAFIDDGVGENPVGVGVRTPVPTDSMPRDVQLRECRLD
jgi:hypothetical protein